MQYTNIYQFPLPERCERPSLSTVWETAQQMETALQQQAAAVSQQVSSLEDAKAEIVTGSYTGNGTENRFIALDFTPEAVLVENKGGERYNGSYCRTGGLALLSLPCGYTTPPYVEIKENGFSVSAQSTNYGANANGNTYYFLAIST